MKLIFTALLMIIATGCSSVPKPQSSIPKEVYSVKYEDLKEIRICQNETMKFTAPEEHSIAFKTVVLTNVEDFTGWPSDDQRVVSIKSISTSGTAFLMMTKRDDEKTYMLKIDTIDCSKMPKTNKTVVLI